MIKKTRKKVFKGGKVFASGGFGCVFRPALKCKNNKSIPKNYVSKIMLTKYAEREDKLIKQAYNVVKNIPNFKDYFLVYDYNVCEPEELSSSDLLDFDNKCKDVLPDHSYSLNKHLYNYKIITFPDGGIDIAHWLDNINDELYSIADLLFNINNSFINLLSNGISKLQKYNFYHMDVKAQNVLTNSNGTTAKLIDYGLAFKDESSNKVPNELKYRTLLFNTPFTILLFQRPFIDILIRKLNKIFKDDENNDLIHDKIGRKTLIKPVVLESLKDFIEEGNNSHWKYLQVFYRELFELLFEESDEGDSVSHFNKMLSNDYYRFEFISEYITEAVNKFIDWNKFPFFFNEEELWSKVFKYNVDIFGFLTIYQNIVSSPSLKKNEYKSLNNWKYISLFQKRIIEILGEYLLNSEYAIKPFPINKIIQDLKHLGSILKPILRRNNSKSKSVSIKNSNKTRKIYKTSKKLK